MKRIAPILAALALLVTPAMAQTLGPPGGGVPSGAAGGALSGTYPNPSLASISQIATSLAIGGCTIGTDALCWTGTATGSGQLNAASFVPTSSTVPTNGIYLSAANTLGLSTNGSARWTLSSGGTWQAVVAAGPAIIGSAGASSTISTLIPNKSDTTTGIGAQAAGNISLIAGATERARVSSVGLTLITISSDAAATDNTLCRDTTSGQVYTGSGALGVCLGTSGRQFKTDFAPMTAGLDEIMKINLWNYRYKSGYGDSGARMQYGPTAQDVEAVLPDLAGHDAKGETINYDWGAFIPITLRAIQQLKHANDDLRAEVRELRQRVR